MLVCPSHVSRQSNALNSLCALIPWHAIRENEKIKKIVKLGDGGGSLGGGGAVSRQSQSVTATVTVGKSALT